MPALAILAIFMASNKLKHYKRKQFLKFALVFSLNYKMDSGLILLKNVYRVIEFPKRT